MYDPFYVIFALRVPIFVQKRPKSGQEAAICGMGDPRNGPSQKAVIMDRKQFFTALRTALMQLNDFQSLRRNPLFPLLTVPPTASPLQLQKNLLDGIEALKRRGGAADGRAYEILYYRYVEQQSQDDLAFQMGISVRQLRREQVNALELLADLLWQQFKLNEHLAATPEPAEAPMQTETAPLPAPEPALHQEFVWLREQFMAEASDILVEWRAAVGDAAIMAHQRHVLLQEELPATLEIVAIPPLVLRQVLLTALTAGIAQAAPGVLQIEIVRRERHVSVTVRPSKTQVEDQPANDQSALALQTISLLLAPYNGWACTWAGGLQVWAPVEGGIPVVLIEDNPDTRLLFHRYVEHSPYCLYTATDAEGAIALTQEVAVRAFILDIMLPKSDGWDVLTRLRHHPSTQTLPVVVCSILPQAELAQWLGATTFLQKPVSQPLFLETLRCLTVSAVRESGSTPQHLG